MDKNLLDALNQKLIDEKARLELELSRFSHRNPRATEAEFEAEFPNLGDKDETESASEVAQFSDNLSLEDELEKGLRDVESALKLMAAGSYGLCKYCKQPIDERRLLARPTSTSCIECKKTLTQEV